MTKKEYIKLRKENKLLEILFIHSKNSISKDNTLMQFMFSFSLFQTLLDSFLNYVVHINAQNNIVINKTDLLNYLIDIVIDQLDIKYEVTILSKFSPVSQSYTILDIY